MNQLFASGGQSIGSFSFNISPTNEHPGLISFGMDWLDLLQSKGLSRVVPNTTVQKHQFFGAQLYDPTLTSIHDRRKTIALTRLTFVGKVMSLLLNMLSRLVITFLPRSKCLNFMAAVSICSDCGTQENKVSHCFHCFPIYLPGSDGTRCHDLSFLNVEF